MLDPVKSMRSRIDFILRLHDREALLPREGQRRFLEADGWVAWPGPALADFLRQFIAHNRMLEGGFVIEDRLLTLADIECPILSVVGTVDEIAPAAGVRAIRFAAPQAEIYELALRAGHFGLVVGSTSNTETWPTVAAWAKWRTGKGELPDERHRDPRRGDLGGAHRPPTASRSATGWRTASSWPGRSAPAWCARCSGRPTAPPAASGSSRGRPPAAPAARPAGADPAEHADLARAARR